MFANCMKTNYIRKPKNLHQVQRYDIFRSSGYLRKQNPSMGKSFGVKSRVHPLCTQSPPYICGGTKKRKKGQKNNSETYGNLSSR